MQRVTLWNLVINFIIQGSNFLEKRMYPLLNLIFKVEEDIVKFRPKHEAYCLFNLWVRMEGGHEDVQFTGTVSGPPHEDIPNPWSSQQKEKSKVAASKTTIILCELNFLLQITVLHTSD